MASTRVVIFSVAAALLIGAAAQAGCPPKQTRDCLINLDALPQISQQIVSDERIAPAAKTAPGATPATPYTGPTVGVTPTPRRYPTVGYHWSFD